MKINYNVNPYLKPFEERFGNLPLMRASAVI